VYVKGDFYSFPAANLRSLENRSNPQGELSEKVSTTDRNG